MIEMTANEKYSGTDIRTILAGKGLDGDGAYWRKRIEEVTADDVGKALAQTPGFYNPERLVALVSPAASGYLEEMAQLARQLTIQRFGKTIRLFAPLYVSNYCTNSCLYCGFNRHSRFERRRLTVEEAVKEADIISSGGFTDILLVSGEDRNFVSVEYLAELAQSLRNKFSFISMEVYALNRDEYVRLFDAGIEGVTVYQETYNSQAYSYYHPAGAKADYDNRLDTADRIASAGMREVGLGSLLGLTDWRTETLALAEHAHYLMKRYWRCHVSFSFPRLRPAHEVERQRFRHLLNDKELVQMIVALRLCFADAGLVLSTREPARLRDNSVNFGITKISAGSKTNPGGYSGRSNSGKQFEIDDVRSPCQVASMLKRQGLEPVWKDWDSHFIG